MTAIDKQIHTDAIPILYSEPPTIWSNGTEDLFKYLGSIF